MQEKLFSLYNKDTNEIINHAKNLKTIEEVREGLCFQAMVVIKSDNPKKVRITWRSSFKREIMDWEYFKEFSIETLLQVLPKIGLFEHFVKIPDPKTDEVIFINEIEDRKDAKDLWI